jgi:hypothetical protein
VAKLKAFTWGYWGWGSESEHFVHAVDSLEKKRGFLPPVFVDLRVARNGKAVNFKGKAFESIVGSRRYVWMPKLGNKRIVSKKGKRIQIVDPNAAEDLLDLLIEKAKARRHVVMFCACEESILDWGDGMPNCHRVEVASLLLKAAKKRGLMLQMSEWPGESPVSLRVKANDSQTRAFATGAHYIPIGSVDARLPAMVTLGWGSNVRFVSPDKTWTVVTGPASVARNKWRLKVFDEADFTEGMSARERGDALLRAGYGPRSTGLRTR